MKPGAALRTTLQRQWQTGGWLSWLLSPLSLLAAGVVAAKRLAYGAGWLRAEQVGVPVIVVGNIYVGGTGKTPFIVAAARALRARGRHPGVISRGYGVQAGPAPRVGCGHLDPAAFGDEPALIARQADVPVAVHPRRADAARALLAAHPHIDVILSDDGLQHLALARDVEIVVQDERGIGNGRLLPAGPLREPASRLRGVDAIVTNRSGGVPGPVPATPNDVRTVDMDLAVEHAWRLADGKRLPLAELASMPHIAAVAGIGNPDRFFATLRRAGVRLDTTLGLPDHYDYAHSPFAAIEADLILVTDKDAVKCPTVDDPRVWAVTVSAHLSDPAFFDWLETRLHGHTSA
ncbi:tetraacyldisaccharide 4'-kinase [Pigmentiphaga sp.]|uniref:tetraacyldisaccharide 4'-kinase n=1 Tax=Pigmentiphaga sp. TaxID=1977564 RepID=UPI00128D2C1C|nr:tetraacyldisaccharide 4'-kinase [Pigmentiphaga sp.]MPS26568.1 tetraacyldisaccharide 4'-kinase [Alcaligenaceae bacterium SAGV5]MPS51171.1 tetraacyldisaccharide 4'-kinase [Alcaligenaceae bacterium SAGV3]MPT57332.1 tetraacyldisaccharide 4'-kinase [Alcaligenaceae bacterium]